MTKFFNVQKAKLTAKLSHFRKVCSINTMNTFLIFFSCRKMYLNIKLILILKHTF